MLCQSCGTDNPVTAQVCRHCAVALGDGTGSRQSWTIGHDPECDFVLEEPTVSGRHCRLILTENEFLLEDLGSSNGTWLNGRRINERARVKPGDPVTLGKNVRLPWSKLNLPRIEQLPAPAVPLITLRSPAMVIGRDPQCDRCLDLPMISWRHARITHANEVFTIEDLGSTNGTFVNGERISGLARVRLGDTVGLGSFSFQFTGVPEKPPQVFGPVTIAARNVSVDVPGKRLIEKVTFAACESEFVGIMGRAGAGKTTLLNALNGYTPPATGTVLIQGRDIYSNHGLRGRIGYAPQDDIMHRELTVEQALHYTARLRLPQTLTDADIEKRIANVLQMLELQGTENVVIGSPEKKGISGGQRKRVNLAMELLTDPQVLFLDEPTSGLSSEDALVVMHLLRGLTKGGKTVLITIHQPGFEIYRMLDSLLVVSKDTGSSRPAQLVYFGPAYPDAIDFLNPTSQARPSPDEIMSGLSKTPTGEWAAKYTASDYKRNYVDERLERTEVSKKPAPKAPPESGLHQWKVLVERSRTIKMQDAAYTAILLGQAPLVGILIALSFHRNAALALFGLVMAAIFAGCLNASREVVGEWAIYRRERMVNLKIPAYAASKFAVLGTVCAVQSFILIAVAWGPCSLQGSFFGSFILLTLTSIVGLAIGLCISAIPRTPDLALVTIFPVLIPMLLLSGGLPIGDVAQSVAALNPARWAFNALIQLQDSNLQGFFKGGKLYPAGACVMVLLVMLAFFSVLLLGILRSKDVKK